MSLQLLQFSLLPKRWSSSTSKEFVLKCLEKEEGGGKEVGDENFEVSLLLPFLSFECIMVSFVSHHFMTWHLLLLAISMEVV